MHQRRKLKALRTWITKLHVQFLYDYFSLLALSTSFLPYTERVIKMTIP